jgi:hypothetical protein
VEERLLLDGIGGQSGDVTPRNFQFPILYESYSAGPSLPLGDPTAVRASVAPDDPVLFQTE